MDCEKCQIEDEYIEEGWLRKAVVKFCPLHAAAGELLKAAKLMELSIEHGVKVGMYNTLHTILKPAIAKAEGGLK